jgi:hypothetical protein
MMPSVFKIVGYQNDVGEEEKCLLMRGIPMKQNDVG